MQLQHFFLYLFIRVEGGVKRGTIAQGRHSTKKAEKKVALDINLELKTKTALY